MKSKLKFFLSGLMLFSLMACDGDNSFEVYAEGLSREQLNNIRFIFEIIDVENEISSKNDIFTVYIKSYDFSRASFVVNRLNDDYLRLDSFSGEFNDEQALINNISGVIRTKIVLVNEIRLITVFIDEFSNESNIRKNIMNLYSSFEPEHVNIVISRYSPIDKIKKYNYEYAIKQHGEL